VCVCVCVCVCVGARWVLCVGVCGASFPAHAQILPFAFLFASKGATAAVFRCGHLGKASSLGSAGRRGCQAGKTHQALRGVHATSPPVSRCALSAASAGGTRYSAAGYEQLCAMPLQAVEPTPSERATSALGVIGSVAVALGAEQITAAWAAGCVAQVLTQLIFTSSHPLLSG
jgi:hypothetical protein